MDYILFVQADVALAPNPEEVMVRSSPALYLLLLPPATTAAALCAG